MYAGRSLFGRRYLQYFSGGYCTEGTGVRETKGCWRDETADAAGSFARRHVSGVHQCTAWAACGDWGRKWCAGVHGL